MKLLIEAGADVNSTDKYGTTPLISITRNSQSDIQGHIEKYVELLLDAGAKFGKVPGQSEEAIMDNCLMRGDWASALHLIDHGVTPTKDQCEVLRSSGCAQVLEKMASIEKAKPQKDDKAKLSGKKVQKKDVDEVDAGLNGQGPLQNDSIKEDENEQGGIEKGAESENAEEEGGTESGDGNEPQDSDELVDIEIDFDDDYEDTFEEQVDLNGAETQKTQESGCAAQGKTVPIDVYLKLKREHERVLEQVGKYLQMLVNREEEGFEAKKTIRELEEKVRLLEEENSSLRSTISELEMENQELHEQRQHRNGHRHLQYQQPSFLPRLQDFPPNDYMHTPFDFGPAPKPDGPLFGSSDDDSPLFYK